MKMPTNVVNKNPDYMMGWDHGQPVVVRPADLVRQGLADDPSLVSGGVNLAATAVPSADMTLGTNNTTTGQLFGTLPDAIMGHWVGPNVFVNDGITYFGTAGQYGDIVATAVDASTPTKQRRFVLASHEADDHNCPAFIQRNDGLILTAYTRHSEDNRVYMRVGGSSGWGPETYLTASSEVTYVQLRRAPSQNNIHMFYRLGSSNEGSWVYRRSTDQGRTWSDEVVLTTKAYLWTAMSTDNVNLRCAAYDHPVLGSDHDIYYFAITLSTGNITIPGGTSIGNVQTGVSLPLDGSTALKAVDVSGSTSTRLFDICKASGNALLACEFTNDSDCNYYRYVFASNGNPYTRKLIRAAGAPFLSSSKYFGGGCFSLSSIDTLFMCWETGGNWYLSKFVTADNGDTWTKTDIVGPSANKLFRPYAVSATQIAYCEATYTSFENFSSVVKIINV